MKDLLVTRGAIVVPPFRYCLTRDMKRAGQAAAFIMVNPSTADHARNDHTIRKLYGFSDRNGIGRFAVVNVFAFQAKDVGALRTAADPVGPQNDVWLERVIRDSDPCIVAWGALAKLPRSLRDRWRDVVAMAAAAGRPLFCLGTAGDGHPLHPMNLGYDARLQPWTPPA